MSETGRASTMVEDHGKKRSAAARFGELSDRLSRTFGSLDRTKEELPAWEPGAELDYLPGGEIVPRRQRTEGRFPIVGEGYDCAAVDRKMDELERGVQELERELREFREKATPTDEVAAEIDKIGSQTAAVLQSAYQQAAEITRGARAEADKCLDDAAANALQITDDANRRLRELDVETDSVWQERARLLDDARDVATGLLSLVEEASARFPAEGQKDDQRTVPAPPPTEEHVELDEPDAPQQDY